MPTQKFPDGTRVILSDDYECYPIDIFPAGLTGTVMEYDGDSDWYWVKLDRHYPALAEWQNQLQIIGDGDDEESVWPAERYLKLDTRPSAERHLCRLYDRWLAATRLPSMSADELIAELVAHKGDVQHVARKLALVNYQIGWLSRFCDLWGQHVERSH